MSHSPPQWRGWVPPRVLAQQRRGMIPRRMIAPPCCVRALNVRTRVRERACVCEGASSEAEPARGGREPSSEADPLEGAVNPRARRNLLEGAFRWATPMGRGDHRSVGRAPCVRLSERCFVSFFCRF
jgi:hypothetical protein